MTEPSALITIDFLTHSKVKIKADAGEIWPHILDVEAWRGGQRLIAVGRQQGQLGERFHAVSPDAPETPLFQVENVELIPEQRRTIRLEELDGSFMGFATWELTPASGETVIAYDVYCRGPMLPSGQAEGELLASAQQAMDAGLLRLKAFVEAAVVPVTDVP